MAPENASYSTGKEVPRGKVSDAGSSFASGDEVKKACIFTPIPRTHSWGGTSFNTGRVLPLSITGFIYFWKHKLVSRCNGSTSAQPIIVLLVTADTRIYSHGSKRCPCTGLGRPRGLREFEAPKIFSQHMNVVSPTHRSPLPPRRDAWYSFLLQAESTPGPDCGCTD